MPMSNELMVAVVNLFFFKKKRRPINRSSQENYYSCFSVFNVLATDSAAVLCGGSAWLLIISAGAREQIVITIFITHTDREETLARWENV